MPQRPPRPVPRRRRRVTTALGLLGVAALGACTSANGQADPPSHPAATLTSAGAPGSSSRPTAAVTPKPKALTVLSVWPEPGTRAVATDTDVVVRLSRPLASASAEPTISPRVAGTWTRAGTGTDATTLRFTPTEPWPGATTIRVTLPAEMVSTDNQKLRSSTTASFRTEPVSPTRVRQLLAELGYLPLSFHVTGRPHTGNATAIAETGTFSWRWSSARAVLGGFWTAGPLDRLTRAAVMDFQRQHSLIADGVAGPQTASALVTDALAHRSNRHTYNYVHVSTASPESLTLYLNGSVKAHVAVSTGLTGATTYVGLFAVYSHVYYTRMRGTDVFGKKYDDDIYWASYFNGGEALHAYPRASYGFPQSNGCVEIAPSKAKAIWPFTPVGTPVSVTD